MSGTGVELNSKEFAAELQRYLTVSNKDVEQILNTKAFFIDLGALAATPRTESSQIIQDLDKPVIAARRPKKGGRFIVQRQFLLINARAGKHGGKGLYGAEMAAAVARLRAVRLRSQSFLKSTWLPALRELAKRVPEAQIYRGDQASGGGSVEVIGREKGSGLPADSRSQGWNLQAEIIASIDVQGRSQARVIPKMEAALQQAIDKETASMAQYFDRKMQQRANEFNSR